MEMFVKGISFVRDLPILYTVDSFVKWTTDFIPKALKAEDGVL